MGNKRIAGGQFLSHLRCGLRRKAFGLKDGGQLSQFGVGHVT